MPNGLKIYCSKWKTDCSQFIFIDKYLKFKDIEYFIHYIKKNVTSFVLCKFPLSSTVELTLGRSILQSIFRFKIGSFERGS